MSVLMQSLVPATNAVWTQVCKMHMFLLLSFCLLQCYGMSQDDDWIDPTDMLNYDAATGRMKNRPQYSTEESTVKDVREEQEVSSCLAENTECKMSVENLNREIEEYRNKGDWKLPASNSDPVFRRYLHKILNGAEPVGLPDDSQPEVHYDAEVILTKDMLTEIQKFLDNSDWNVGALDEALSKTLVRFKHHNEEEWRWKFEDYFGIDVFTTFMISLSVLCIVSVIATEMWTHVGWFTQIKRLICISFFVSIGWNWMYLYKVAFAERQAEAAKLGKFDSCVEKISWTESLIGWFKASASFQNDPCEEYFKIVMVHPILMVSPTKAVALTFTDFITEPLKHVGKAIGEFLHNLLAEIPLFYQLPVLLIIALLLLATCYGGSTSIGQWWDRRERHGDRLPIENQQRPIYLQVVEGGNRPPYHEQLTHQTEYAERNRDSSNRRPESLQALDCVDRNHQKQLSGCEGDYIGEQQRKSETLHKKHFEQKQNESLQKESFEPQIKDDAGEENTREDPKRKNDVTVEKSAKQQKDGNREEESFGSQNNKEEPLPRGIDLEKTPVPSDNEPRNVTAAYTEFKLNQTDVETLKSMEPCLEEHGAGKAAD